MYRSITLKINASKQNTMRLKKKIQSKYFKAIVSGKKRFEVRLGDFKSKPGDTLTLLEQKNRKLTGKKIECEVLYKFNTKEIEKFYPKKDIEKYGLVILAVRKKYKY